MNQSVKENRLVVNAGKQTRWRKVQLGALKKDEVWGEKNKLETHANVKSSHLKGSNIAGEKREKKNKRMCPCSHK